VKKRSPSAFDRGVLERIDTSVLPPDEQRALVAVAQPALAAQQTLESGRYVWTRKEVGRLRAAIRKGLPSRDRLVQHSLRFVWGVARKYRRGAIADIDDLVAEGCLGVMHAIEKFELDRNLQFITYASWWVRAFIQRFLVYNSTAVYVPVHRIDDVYRMRRRRRAMEKVGMESSAIEEVLDREFHPQVKACERLVFGGGVRELDATYGDDGDESTTLHNAIPDPREAVDETLAEESIRAKVQQAVLWRAEMSARDRMLLRDRLMPEGGEGQTLAEIGEQMNLTRERVRQIEGDLKPRLRKAIEKLLPDEAKERMARARQQTERPSPSIVPSEQFVRPKPETLLVLTEMRPPVRSVTVAANGLRVGQVVPAPTAKPKDWNGLPGNGRKRGAPCSSDAPPAPAPAPKRAAACPARGARFVRGKPKVSLVTLRS
jgi:RNA polymerase nonessential primary-like sigma factor